jgi:hypothetical protein
VWEIPGSAEDISQPKVKDRRDEGKANRSGWWKSLVS